VATVPIKSYTLLYRMVYMDVSNIAQLATNLSAQRVASEVTMAVAKIANQQVAAKGDAAVQLIESVPKPQGSLGHHVDVKV